MSRIKVRWDTKKDESPASLEVSNANKLESSRGIQPYSHVRSPSGSGCRHRARSPELRERTTVGARRMRGGSRWVLGLRRGRARERPAPSGTRQPALLRMPDQAGLTQAATALS